MMSTAAMDRPGAARRPVSRRRRWPWVLLVLAIVLAGVLVAVDRIAVGVAESKIADRLTDQNPFVGRPSVSIHGFPFLTQAAGGKYDDIEVSGTSVPVGTLSQVQIDTHLHGVHLALSDAVNHVKRVPVDQADLTLTATLADLATASGIDGLTLTSNGDRVTIQAPVTLPLLGRTTVSASGRLVISSAGDISADLLTVQGVGVPLPDSVLSAARSALGLVIHLDNLPFHAVATSIRAENGTVSVLAAARDVVLE